MCGEGISREGDLLDLAVEKRIVERSGAWFAYSGERLGRGRENPKQFLKDNPSVRQAIGDRVRRDLGLIRETEAVAAASGVRLQPRWRFEEAWLRPRLTGP